MANENPLCLGHLNKKGIKKYRELTQVDSEGRAQKIVLAELRALQKELGHAIRVMAAEYRGQCSRYRDDILEKIYSNKKYRRNLKTGK